MPRFLCPWLSGTSPTTTAPARLATVYATDEDIARRAPLDFFNLCPRWQVRAKGTDGAFGAGSPWALTSATVPFQSNGVAGNNVVALAKPGVYTTPNELYAVDSAVSGTLNLRRLGEALDVGQAPGGLAGVTGISFEVRTFATQIDNASYDANKFLGIDPNLANKAPGLLYDPRELTMYVVLTVLRRAYIDGVKTKADDYADKLAMVSAELNDLRSRLTVQWGSLGEGDVPHSVFSFRLRR